LDVPHDSLSLKILFTKKKILYFSREQSFIKIRNIFLHRRGGWRGSFSIKNMQKSSNLLQRKSTKADSKLKIRKVKVIKALCAAGQPPVSRGPFRGFIFSVSLSFHLSTMRYWRLFLLLPGKKLLHKFVFGLYL
jgi:hypothetical protein